MKKHLSRPMHYFRKKTINLRAEPDFLIIGAQKIGTTSLYYDLSAHPKLKPNVGPKEVSFFTTYYRRGIDYYRSYFPFKKENHIFSNSLYYFFYPPRILSDSSSFSQYKAERHPSASSAPSLFPFQSSEAGGNGAAVVRRGFSGRRGSIGW